VKPTARVWIATSAAAFALAVAIAPSLASAAELGRLQVVSALGQPLVAELELVAVGPDGAARLTARIADEAAHRRTGLRHDAAAASASVAIVERDGRLLLEIRSTRPVVDPLVDLLIELAAPAGRQLKAYTVSLDPPGAARPAEALEGRSIAARLAAAGEQLGVIRGDTLSGLAVGLRPDGVTLNQAMVALYRANPDAFIGNLNLVKAGSTLTVPDRAAMVAVDVAEANRIVRVQVAEFAAYRSRLAGAAATAVAQGEAGQPAGQSAAGAVEGPAAVGAVRQGGDRLVLSRPAAADAAAAPIAAAGAALGAQASREAADEALVARDAALREANSRIAELERNLGDLQQLLQLRSQSLADAQRQAESAASAGQTAAGVVSPAPGVEGAAVEGATPATSAAAPAAAAASAPAEPPAETPAAGGAAETAPPAGCLPALVGLGVFGAGLGWYLLRRRPPSFSDTVAEVLVPEPNGQLDALRAHAVVANAPPVTPDAATELARVLGGRVELPSLDLEPKDVSVLDTLADREVAQLDPDSEAWQAMATKLDLAAAFDEMGDREGARALLHEIVQGGDAKQREQARAMLDRFG